MANSVASLGAWIVRAFFLFVAGWKAYHFRMHAINTYGRVIHEFDPWFNYRATEYLAANGWTKFFTWFDYMSWYPLGRPVGTTIYPGMQITSVTIWKVLNAAGYPMSLNDVCCFVPVWGGVCATMFLGLLTWECSGSANAGVMGALVMSIIPAHIMRSVGGGYDNESVAITAMCMTFYFWCRSLRSDSSWWIGILTGFAYIFMVAAWGGFVFVVNMIGLHAFLLVIIGRYTPKLHRAYSLWFVIGTIGAMQVPVVGMGPIKSMEQLMPCGVFFFLQLYEYCDYQRRTQKLDDAQLFKLRQKVFGAAAAVGGVVVMMLYPTGYFGPLSSRIRGLFVKHTRTGNPLVDSVAEHQPASAHAYFQYLHYMCYVAPIGVAILFFKPTDAKFFLIAYAFVAYFFSSKMVRLIVLMGPVTSASAGIALGAGLEWFVVQFEDQLAGAGFLEAKESAEEKKKKEEEQAAAAAAAAEKEKRSKGKSKKKRRQQQQAPKPPVPESMDAFWEYYNQPRTVLLRKVGAVAMILAMYYYGSIYHQYSKMTSVQLSHPSIMYKANLRDGTQVMVDDYREAYWWLRDSTPEDSRVMAWWDYGYQISGIANRTTIADGNTWNHEHIATLGRCLTSPVKRAHKIVRHLADYILVWTGGGGDDLAKSPHMARIGNSVYDDICPGDPTCRKFGFLDRHHTPTPMMKASLLYRLHSQGQVPGVTLDQKLFKEVYTSKYNKVRIYQVMKVSKKSKAWIADPKNRQCDAPGSWYCTGQYPPALDKLMEKKRDFAQLEDFNAKKDARSKTYQQQYMDRMAGKGASQEEMEQYRKSKKQKKREREERKREREARKKTKKPKRKGRKERKTRKQQQQEQQQQQQREEEEEDDDEEDDSEDLAKDFDDSDDGEEEEEQTEVGEVEWMDTGYTSRMWELISENNYGELKSWIETDPMVVHVRSADGRGPLWWAYEYDRKQIIKLLIANGVPENEVDARGILPKSLA